MLRNSFGPIAPAFLLIVTAQAVSGCKKEEPPPPLPTAAPVATAPPAPLQLKPEDAGMPKPAESAKPTGTGHGTAGGLSACCAALQQNAASAPAPTNGYMLQAAAACKAAVAAGNTAGIAAMIRGLLQGAGMPSSCK